MRVLLLLFAVFLICLPAVHLARKLRHLWRRKRGSPQVPGALLLLMSVATQAQTMPPPPAETVQNYDTTAVSWTLPPGMSHKVARQAVQTLSKLGATLDTSRLTQADSTFLYQWMPGILVPPRRRR